MLFIKKAEDTMWRALEWSFVMGALSWVFVRLWISAGWQLRGPEEHRRSGSGDKPGAGNAG